MDNQDKLFDKIKQASQNAEFKDFPGMEKVWSRVEEKLDKKEDKKTIALWKKIAIAASLLLIISVGSQFLKTEKKSNIENSNEVVNSETPKEAIQKTDSQKDQIATSEDSGIVSKTEAEKILNNQIKQQPPVAIHVTQSPNINSLPYEPSPVIVYNESASAPSVSYGYEAEKDSITKDKALTYESAKSAKKEFYRIADSDNESLRTKKSAPLVILNGNAMAHTDDAKRDKMMQEELPNLNPENVESLVILDEPLYIIDGIYYSENDLFGKNPTSPYAPLNKQEIKTITILQDLEATSKYGEKGKKGVVIITTKTGKPALKK
ncbi:hypothetical protein [Flavobacterium sp. HTF]|uniref:hypothetical protein n=1 Tax=Flavobacterium sp. HTF TaxID=2170732 RepID=UPI000D5DA0C7|nr:hypothetical protein [Flavobacterium sp. HTF]PWB26141.1 hypothetical protein DCO46_06945 [Flavobacterium sp. HTF]